MTLSQGLIGVMPARDGTRSLLLYLIYSIFSSFLKEGNFAIRVQ